MEAFDDLNMGNILNFHFGHCNLYIFILVLKFQCVVYWGFSNLIRIVLA